MTWEYVAGFFDGEGCIQVLRKEEGNVRQRVLLTIAQVERQAAILTLMQGFFAAHEVHAHLTSYTYTKRVKPVTMVCLRVSSRAGVIRALEQLLPLLHVKKLQAEKALYVLNVPVPTYRGERR